MRRTDNVSVWRWPLTLELMARVADEYVPSYTKFAIRTIWRTMCVSIIMPDDSDLWPSDLETGTRVASKMGNLSSNVGTRLLTLELFAMYATDDGLTRADGQKQRLGLLPLPYGGGGIINVRHLLQYIANIFVNEAIGEYSRLTFAVAVV